MTVWEHVFRMLKEAGINVYPPATKKGECTEKYVVMKQDGSAQMGTYSSESVYYHFMLYVPQNKYNELGEYEEEVKGILDTKLYPLLMPTGSDMSDYYDDSVKAHMRSFLYRNVVRNKHL